MNIEELRKLKEELTKKREEEVYLRIPGQIDVLEVYDDMDKYTTTRKEINEIVDQTEEAVKTFERIIERATKHGVENNIEFDSIETVIWIDSCNIQKKSFIEYVEKGIPITNEAIYNNKIEISFERFDYSPPVEEIFYGIVEKYYKQYSDYGSHRGESIFFDVDLKKFKEKITELGYDIDLDLENIWVINKDFAENIREGLNGGEFCSRSINIIADFTKEKHHTR